MKEELNEIEIKCDLLYNEIKAKTSASSCWMMGIFFLGLKRKAHHPREATLVLKDTFQTHVGACIARPKDQNVLHTNNQNNNTPVGARMACKPKRNYPNCINNYDNSNANISRGNNKCYNRRYWTIWNSWNSK